MEPAKKNKKAAYTGPTMPFYIHVLKEIPLVFLLIGVLVSLAVFLPIKLDEMADPFVTPEHIKPEWYFLAGYQLLKVADTLSFLGAWAPKLVGVAGQGVFMLLLLAVPFIDRSPDRGPGTRKGMIMAGIITILMLVALTVWGHFS